MNSQTMIDRLAADLEVFRSLLRGIPAEQASWKPAPEKWSVLEVVGHLYDEERDDFRMRVDLTLHHPDTPWPRIDPEGWARERKYNEREFAPTLDGFLAERETSVGWLRTLIDPDWTVSRHHPAAGTLSAGDFLTSWVAHDFLHLRQLSRLYWAYYAHLAEPFSVRYAGE
jgi:hypothetical protein